MTFKCYWRSWAMFAGECVLQIPNFPTIFRQIANPWNYGPGLSSMQTDYLNRVIKDCEQTLLLLSTYTASRLLSAMDASVDPCDDFFEYACGTWNRIHIIPDDKSNYNTFRKLGDELHATLKRKINQRYLNNKLLINSFSTYVWHDCFVLIAHLSCSFPVKFCAHVSFLM